MTDEQRAIEAEQLRTLQEQQEEILQLQSEVHASSVATLQTPTRTKLADSIPYPHIPEMIAIPNPESVANNLQVNVLDQISDTIQNVDEEVLSYDRDTSACDGDGNLG